MAMGDAVERFGDSALTSLSIIGAILACAVLVILQIVIVKCLRK